MTQSLGFVYPYLSQVSRGGAWLAGLILTCAVLSGCNSQPSPSQSPEAVAPTTSATPTPDPSSSEAVTDSAPSSAPAAPVEDTAFLISNQGIGDARLGMTLAELKQALGEGVEYQVQTGFLVDFDAIAIQKSGEVQYYILYLAGETFTDDDVIQGLFTDNPAYQTAEGVGSGTPLADAEAAYGQATLSYNLANEGREYVRFADYTASNVAFGTGNANAETAGIYPDTQNEYQETQEFRPDATIMSVLVVCFAEECATPSDTTP